MDLLFETTGLHHKNNMAMLLRLEKKKKVNLNKTSWNITITTILPAVSPLTQPYQLLEIVINLKTQPTLGIGYTSEAVFPSL